jgi:hypothetical protein
MGRPCRRRRSAATLLSTPPDIATRSRSEDSDTFAKLFGNRSIANGAVSKASRLTLEFGHFDGRMSFVPEGQADRNLARSAWDNATPKRRPVGYGVIRAGVRADSMIGMTKFQMPRLQTFTLDVGIRCARSYRTLRICLASYPDILLVVVVVVALGRFPGSTIKAPFMPLPSSPMARSPSDNDDDDEDDWPTTAATRLKNPSGKLFDR